MNTATAFSLPTHDPLQNALVWLMHGYNKRASLEAVLNGLPLKKAKDGLLRLDAQLFVRAAKRAGFESRTVKRKLNDLSPALLPVVVQTKSKEFGLSFAILKELTADDAVVVHMHPMSEADTAAKEEIITRKQFQKLYTGRAILTTPQKALDISADRLKSTGHWFWSTLAQFKKIYVQVALAAVLINILALVSPLFIMNVYDRVVPNTAFETLWVLAIGVTTAYVFDFLFRQLRAYFVDVAGKGADILLASRLYQQLLNIRQGAGNSSAGAFANQLREFETLRDFFGSATIVSFIDLPFMLLFIVVIGLIAGPVAIVPLVAIPIVLLVSWLLQAPVQGAIQQNQAEMDGKHGHLVETIQGLETIKTLNLQSHVQAKWEEFVGRTARLGNQAKFTGQLGIHFTMFATQMVTVAMVIVGTYAIANGDITVGALVASTILVGRTLAPLSQAVALYIRYQQAKIAMTSLNEIMAAEVERPEGEDRVHIRGLQGAIEYQNVNFAYPQSPMNSLHGVSLKIKSGERVGLIGRAGSGKSTLSRLLLNLYNPTEGQVLLDGIEIRQLEPAELRAHIAYVPQNPFLFKGTLRENILLSCPEADDEVVQKALDWSNVNDFANRHPAGLEMPVAEGGRSLSSGQRQAVGIARAIVRALTRDVGLVVLDDPTSEMDQRSEEVVRKHMPQWVKNRTMMLITHRGTMLQLVERLCVMDYGKLVADGPKEKVIQALKGKNSAPQTEKS